MEYKTDPASHITYLTEKKETENAEFRLRKKEIESSMPRSFLNEYLKILKASKVFQSSAIIITKTNRNKKEKSKRN